MREKPRSHHQLELGQTTLKCSRIRHSHSPNHSLSDLLQSLMREPLYLWTGCEEQHIFEKVGDLSDSNSILWSQKWVWTEACVALALALPFTSAAPRVQHLCPLIVQ